MMLLHQDPEFAGLLQIVARETGIAAALIEKDYWVTHTLWAVVETGLDVWLKGGTSLSKAFGLIQRFSEDLDLMIEQGSAAGLPQVSSWTSGNKGPRAQRKAFYDALACVLVVPGARVERDLTRIDTQARSADYLGFYPGAHLHQLAPSMSPFVRLEVGRARVVPHVTKSLSSFIHDFVDAKGMIGEYRSNRPAVVACVHPVVTLFEKLDAMARRYARQEIDPHSFVRHYEDATQIIQSIGTLPELGSEVSALARDMLQQRDIAALPQPYEPALVLADPDKRSALEQAHAEIAPMFWGPRIPLDQACEVIRSWLGSQKLAT